MADVLSSHQSHTTPSAHLPDSHAEQTKPRLPPMSIPIPTKPTSRNGQISLDVFSPVNQNGSFEFDRVLKSGHVSKKSRKTKQWKKFFLVLRPNLLSMYRNESEEKLLKQVNLSELTAVNILKDPKGRRQHMFGLFTPSHNYHFQATSDSEVQAWVTLIRREARIDEEEETMIFGSPAVADSGVQALAHGVDSNQDQAKMTDRLLSSSPEPAEAMLSQSTVAPTALPPEAKSRPREQSVNEFDYSGQEQGSFSDFSDTAPQSLPRSSYNPPRAIAAIPLRSSVNQPPPFAPGSSLSPIHQLEPQTPSQAQSENSDPQRVLWQGYLLCLKSKGGVRQWKKLWAVLRPAHLAFYKNDDEYSAHLLIPLSTVLSAIEIDPLSKSKAFCLQIIAEDKNYRFCAENEDQLARCLGAIKSLLARRKGASSAAGSAPSTTPATNKSSTVGPADARR